MYVAVYAPGNSKCHHNLSINASSHTLNCVGLIFFDLHIRRRHISQIHSL